MAKNQKSPAPDFSQQAISESAQQIWLAGMGAFAKAQQEGGRVFEALVKEGVALQRKSQAVARERVEQVASVVSRVSPVVGEGTSPVGQGWGDRLGNLFEERVARSLNKLGIPSAQELAQLTQRVAVLEAELARWRGDVAPTSTAKAPARRTTVAPPGPAKPPATSAARTRAPKRKPD